MPMLKIGTEGTTPIELHYQDYGTGAPVVLIHGWPLSGRSWEAQVPSLVEAGYRVITYDRRGFGQSSQPWSGYDYDTFAADLHALMTHLDLKGAALVGFSMGGGEVARYIGTYGTERVTKAVFAAAVTPYLYKSADNPEGPRDDAAIKKSQSAIIADRMAFLDEFTGKFFSAQGQLRVSEAQRIHARNIAEFASSKGTLDCTDAFSRTDFRGDLAKFKLSTLIIHGDADAIVPFEASGARTHKAIAGSILHVVKGAPHGFNLSHADEFNRQLVSFLAN